MTIYLEKIKTPQISDLSTYLDKSRYIMSKFKSKTFDSNFLKNIN